MLQYSQDKRVNPVLGIFYLAAGGFAAGSFYKPYIQTFE